jgi:hypothetical protein
MHDQRGLGKCKVGAPHSHEGLGELVGDVWFVRMAWVTSGWFVVCSLQFAIYVRDKVENNSMVAHDKTNGWWELWGLMR